MDPIAGIREISSTWDVVLVAFFFIAGFFAGASMGRIRLIVILASIYVARVLFPIIPSLDALVSARSPMEAFALKSALFVALVFFVYILLMRSAILPPLRFGWRGGGWMAITILSTLAVGHLLTVIFQYLPGASQDTLSPIVQFLFFKEEMRTAWTILPIVSLLFVRGGKE